MLRLSDLRYKISDIKSPIKNLDIKSRYKISDIKSPISSDWCLRPFVFFVDAVTFSVFGIVPSWAEAKINCDKPGKLVVGINHFPCTFRCGDTIHFFFVVMTYFPNIHFQALVCWKLLGTRNKSMAVLIEIGSLVRKDGWIKQWNYFEAYLLDKGS